jgi:hypothetical protein
MVGIESRRKFRRRMKWIVIMGDLASGIVFAFEGDKIWCSLKLTGSTGVD